MLLAALSTGSLLGQDDWGFGGGGDFSSSLGGSVSASLPLYFHDLGADAENPTLGNIFSGTLNFQASTSLGESFIGLNLAVPSTAPVGETSPISLDEAYLRLFLVPSPNLGKALTLEAGLMRIKWGRADSLGPLDVINPLDYSDLSLMDDPLSIKIPRPLIHGTWNFEDGFSRLRAVFVPGTSGLKYALDGRWLAASTVADHPRKIITSSLPSQLIPRQEEILQMAKTSNMMAMEVPDYSFNLKYFQAGLRFETQISGIGDLGGQYFYGRLPRPAYKITGLDALWADLMTQPPTPTPTPNTSLVNVTLDYNPYHQIGADYAGALGPVNLRAELAANITGDYAGTDGAVYNPHLLWSLGLDYLLPQAVTLNVQINETIILFHDKITKLSYKDVESETLPTSTRITAYLSRTFLLGELETRFTAVWALEEFGAYLIPALLWTRDELGAELSGGIFLGDTRGELGQYRNNSFLRAALTYTF
jgi:hypothetical protein